MFALVPALRALLEDMVVVLFRLFDEAFQADVPTDFVTVLIPRQEREQARDASVAVSKKVDHVP